MNTEEHGMEYEFGSYEEMEAKLRELFESTPEITINLMRVMDGGRIWLTVEEQD
jgi:hypothetical protein